MSYLLRMVTCTLIIFIKTNLYGYKSTTIVWFSSKSVLKDIFQYLLTRSNYPVRVFGVQLYGADINSSNKNKTSQQYTCNIKQYIIGL